jgi:hypothetical protein
MLGITVEQRVSSTVDAVVQWERIEPPQQPSAAHASESIPRLPDTPEATDSPSR